MTNITVFTSASLMYVISKFLGVSPYTIIKTDKTYRIISKPSDFICTATNFLIGGYIIYLSVMDQLGLKSIAPNEMTRQGSTFLIRTVIPINLFAIIMTFFQRKKIVKAIDNMHYVDQELEEIDSPMNMQEEFEEICLRAGGFLLLTMLSSVLTYAILRDITDSFVMFAQLLLCYHYNVNYLLFIVHFTESQGGVKRRFVKLNHGFK